MSRSIQVALIGLAFYLGASVGVCARDLSALARVLPSDTVIRDVRGGGIEVVIKISQAVPYRVFTLDAPKRLVIDFREVVWDGLETATLISGKRVTGARFGLFRPGWSRMIVDLPGSMQVASAGMETDPVAGAATVNVRLFPASDKVFAAAAGAPDSDGWGLPKIANVPPAKARQTGDGPLVVVLDPGHGGVDPGAERDGVTEADLMLTFALELKDSLLRAGNFKVILTREEDGFVPLETRVSLARAAGADVFLSLHADALAEGNATGATVYTLSDTASDAASEKLAERHDRADLLAGVDLTGQDDVIAGVLMDLARIETAPRTDRLASNLVEGLSTAIGEMHKRPRLSAGFSVLKAPDIPSVLIEVGFLSSQRDLANLTSPNWRARAAMGIRDALQSWAIADAAEAALLRK